LGGGGSACEGSSRARQQVQQLIEALHRNPEKPWTVPEMAMLAGMSILR